MTHAISLLQAQLVTALAADAALVSALGGARIYDAPNKGQVAPYVAILRHDLSPRNGDLTPGNDHRLAVAVWHDQPSRSAVLAVAERVAAVALAGALDGPELVVTHRQHVRTDSAIDPESGFGRALVSLRFLTEPN